MRAIRVWYKRESRWLSPDEFKINADGSVSTYGVYAHKSDLVRCDSTGLKDKNEKEIYEGDIVHYKYDFRGSDNWGVAWGDDGWIMRRENRQTGDDNCFDDPHHNNWSCAEIIGNIYENPELLK